MFTHEDVWRAIDMLARKNNLSTSALARKAGLDATSFNRSKRVTPKGRPRWPSSESLAKVLACTNTPLEEFTALMRPGTQGGVRTTVPYLTMAQARRGGRLDSSGRPCGDDWAEIPCPGVADAHAYALRIVGDALEPAYRDGDVIVVSPDRNVHAGDRVLVQFADGELAVRLLRRLSGSEVELSTFATEPEIRVEALSNIRWMARILWVSQ